MKTAKIIIDGKEYEFPVIEGTEQERAIDISELRAQTGCITLDNGYQNTGACASSITYIDGDKGILRYRGFDITEVAEKLSFVETAYMLIYGSLPTIDQKSLFSRHLTENSMLQEDMIHYFVGMPPHAHPMAILCSMVNSLSIFYPNSFVDDEDPQAFNVSAARLISMIRTIAAFSYKK